MGITNRERGPRLEEGIEIMRRLWAEERVTYQGRFYQLEDAFVEPKPVQKPPPIWVVGTPRLQGNLKVAERNLRRVARLGDGWYPIGTNPQHPLDTLPRLRAGIERMRRLVGEAGRDPAQIAIGYRVQRHGPGAPALSDNGERRLFSGSPADIAGDLRAFRELGVSAVDLSFVGKTVESTLAEMKRFRDEVASRL
jgi:alkanesulfonate monooxygenase SsuD/methylene tetrahydromethanopterin reductase-like flavin-dependent oxidoreductase (luciferase family)